MVRIIMLLLLVLASGGACAGESKQVRSEKHNFNIVTMSILPSCYMI